MQPPCPQGLQTVPPASVPAEAWDFAIERVPVEPRGGRLPALEPLPIANVPGIRWPYHLPRWNALDCLWWTMLARASYSTTATLFRQVCEWAGPVIRWDYRAPQAAPDVGWAMAEMTDCLVIVAPGTASERDFLQYFLSHSVDSITSHPLQGWSANSTWYNRGERLYAALGAWSHTQAKPHIWIGHSSGGATAALGVYFRMVDAPLTNHAQVTFGSPRWGTPSLLALRTPNKQPQTIEFSTRADPVPLLPPAWSLLDGLPLYRLIRDRPEYIRLGQLLELRGAEGAPPRGNSTADTIGRAINTVLSPLSAIRNHAAANYGDSALAWATAWAAAQKQTWLLDDIRPIIAALTAAGL